MAELADLFLTGLTLRGAHAHSERRLDRVLGAFDQAELQTPDEAMAALLEGVLSCHDLGEWCDPTRRAAAEPWVRAFDTHRADLMGQLHRYRWPKCTAAVNECVEHRKALATLVDDVPIAAGVQAAGESTLRIGALESRVRHGGLSEADALAVLAQLHDCKQWVQPIDDVEDERLRRVLRAAEPRLSELARQLHSHKFPSCQQWPHCEHSAQLLPPAGPVAVPAPPPLTQEQHKAQQVELGIGQLSLEGLQFGHSQPEPEASSGGHGGVSAMRNFGRGSVGQQTCTPAPLPVAKSAATSGAALPPPSQQQSMQTENRPICCYSQRPEGCPHTSSTSSGPSCSATAVFSCCHGRHVKNESSTIAQQLLAGGCSNGVRCPVHVGIDTLIYKCLGPELGYATAELKPVEETLRAALVLTTRHLVLLGVVELQRLTLPPLVERWLSDFVVTSTKGSSGKVAA